MDQKKFAELLKKYNGGIFRGSKRKLAKELGYTEAAISNISSGAAKPSEELVKAIAKILKVNGEELKKIFDLNSNNIIIGDKNQQNISSENQEIVNLKAENSILKKQLEVFKQQVEFLQQQLDFYKNKK